MRDYIKNHDSFCNICNCKVKWIRRHEKSAKHKNNVKTIKQ